ncbi:helix-turn-helix domain-containing protein [Candidatus Nitrosocosmicus arcticus]|uniref:HTH arsR-type domain-containing protein n=1 Tax=Candidatus Nitrosocosmicus arcticus TaxID=2035267 RepID=A0A557SUA3_9ARCH|nr:helix-turn-helix domain-containing protein [Candidatus Nitrosocosmicus arcticus]TVP40186.1 hypothetical protein NARC_90092 [Candidatus Nitrosocosmicus arcticus]
MKNTTSYNQENVNSVSVRSRLNEKDDRLMTHQDIEELSNRPLARIFTSPSSARIIDFFIAFREFDYSEVDIARKNNLSQKTVSKELENLLKEDLIKITRKSGRSIMYKLNEGKTSEGLILYVNNKIENIRAKV